MTGVSRERPTTYLHHSHVAWHMVGSRTDWNCGKVVLILVGFP